MNPEQVSIFDINHHDNHRKDLCIDLTKMATPEVAFDITFVPPTGVELEDIKKHGRILSTQERNDRLTFTCTEDTAPVSPAMHDLLQRWSTNQMDMSVPYEPMNILLIDKSKEPHDDDPVKIIQSQHLRWTTEHATDVLIAKYPSQILTNCWPIVG